MVTVLAGAVAGALFGGTAVGATVLGAVGLTGLAATATAAVIGGGLAYAATQAFSPDQPAQIAAPGAASTLSDKTSIQSAEQLQQARIGGEETESQKRKRKGAKQKFKIEKDKAQAADKTDAGVQVPGEGADSKKKVTPGVQI